MAERSTAPVSGERGYANPHAGASYWTIDADLETVPELAWPESINVYNRMRRGDSQVISVLKAVTLPIRSTPWRISPGEARPEVAAYISDELGLPLTEGAKKAMPRTRGRFSWSEHLRQALLCLPLGAMYFEQVVRVDDAGNVHLRKLAPRMPHTLHDIHVASDGGLISIEQSPPAQVVGMRSPDRSTLRVGESVTIPVERLVAYVNEMEGSDWAGTSLLRGAYKHWLIKDRLLRVEAVSVERNGMGVPVYTGPPNAGDEDLEKGRKMANEYRAGDSSGAAIPFEAKLDLKGVNGNLVPAREVINYHDAQIGRTALAHFLNLDGKGGSYALASTQADLFITSLTGVAQMIADTATAHIVEDLVDWQFGLDEPAPRIVFDDIGSSDAAVAQAIRTLVDSGVISPDQTMEDWARRSLGIPDRESGEGGDDSG